MIVDYSEKYLHYWVIIVEDVSILEKLETILSKTVEMLEESKEDMFSISESSRSELNRVKKQLEEINVEIGEIIDQIEVMEKRNQRARVKLMKVSRDIYHHTEEDIKEAYEEAEETSVKIAVLREKEEQLKDRRRDLEKRVVRLKKTIEKAENLVSRVGIVRQYLFGELGNISEQVDDMRQKQKMALKIIEAQEDERKRLAREIHDGPAQSLANLVFRVELSEQLLDENINKAR
ncbi:MAG: histidine kinase [Halanaerobiales bacterium]